MSNGFPTPLNPRSKLLHGLGFPNDQWFLKPVSLSPHMSYYTASVSKPIKRHNNAEVILF